MRILVSGSVAYDQIMSFPGRFKDNILPEKIHILNVSFFITQLRESFGGTAGNICYNLALLGHQPVPLSNVGNDFSRYQRWFRQHGIATSQLHLDKTERTAVAYIITDQDDNQIAGFYPGAMKRSYQVKPSTLAGVRMAIIAPDNPTNYTRLAAVYRKHKLPYLFDPGQQVASLTGAQIRQATAGAYGFISNDYELSLALKKSGWSLASLRSKVELVVTTLGSKGSVIYRGKETVKIPPAKPKNTSDPTGAGDAYRAGLVTGLLNNWPLAKVGRFAGLVAVYTVEKHGTQTHRFTWKDLEKRYQQNFHSSL